MTRIVERAEHEKSEGGVVSDVRASYRSNRKFLVAAVLGLPIILTALVWLLLPRESERELSLEVAPAASPALSELRKSLGQGEPALNPEAIGQQAVSFLRAGNFDPVEVIPKYDYETGQVDVLLRTQSKETLDDLGSKEVVDSVETGFQRSYEEGQVTVVEGRIKYLEVRIENTQGNVTQLERLIEENSSLLADNSPLQEGARSAEAQNLSNYEAQREGVLTILADLEAEKRYMEQAYEDLPQMAREQVSVEVVTESEAREATQLAPTLTTAALLGLIVAVALTMRITAEQAAKSTVSSA